MKQTSSKGVSTSLVKDKKKFLPNFTHFHYPIQSTQILDTHFTTILIILSKYNTNTFIVVFVYLPSLSIRLSFLLLVFSSWRGAHLQLYAVTNRVFCTNQLSKNISSSKLLR